MIHDLRQWLSRVEELGELVCVDQPLDPIEEMGAVTYLVAKQTPSPAVLFERPKGFESSPLGARLLWNILGPSMRRTALTHGIPYYTTVAGARAAVQAIGTLREGCLEVAPLQSYL